MRLSWDLVLFNVCGFRCLFIPGFPYLALSALALSHRFSGFRSLSLSDLFHPETFLRFFLQSFLLLEIEGFFFQRFFSPLEVFFRLVPLAASRTGYVFAVWSRVLTTALQFGFRGSRPLNSSFSFIWGLIKWMVDALLVFSPLQGTSSLLLRSPHFDQMGVAPLLPRRLIRFTKSNCSLFAGFPWHVSSLRTLLLRVLHLLSCDNPHSSLTNFSARALRRSHQPLFQSCMLCRYVLTVWVLYSCEYTKQFQPSLDFVLFFN